MDVGERVDVGAVYVIFGRDTDVTGPFPPSFPLVTLLPGGGGDGSDGFAMIGARLADLFGYTVSAAGDVDGDGDGTQGFVLEYVFYADHTGVPMAGAAGDVNGDGIGDLLIGAGLADRNGVEDAGRTYVLFGRDTSLVGNFPASSVAALLPPGGGDGTQGVRAARLRRGRSVGPLRRSRGRQRRRHR